MTQGATDPIPFGSESLAQVRLVLRGALIALDFDGTLAPIQADPSTVRMAHGALEVLHALAERGAKVAIVTGRDAETVLRLGDLASIPGLVIEAIYGAERWSGGRLVTPPTPLAMSHARDDAARILVERAAGDPGLQGAWLEDKRINMVVHTRRAGDPEGAQRALAPHIEALSHRYGLEMHLGKNVLEIRLPGLDKGASLRRLLAETPAEAPSALVFAGDDLGDVPAMDAARQWGADTGRPVVTIASGAPRSSPVARAATLTVGGPAEVVAALRTLL
ncbi:MAG: trehalose-phosphatase [Jatrophihabitantaceae bacterium]|nr:trehalose-phosphatase [Jatrophihabitantaceae bacterium]